jgi:rod shape-determining protein MreD
MRRLALILLMALAALLQASLVPAFRPLGVVPNLALVIFVLVSLELATSEALVLGVAAGLVLDIASGANFGLWMGVFMLVALICGLLHRAGIELDRLPVALILVLVATVVMAAVIWIGLATTISRWPGLSFGGRLVIELMINLILTMLLRRPLQLLAGGARAGHAGG